MLLSSHDDRGECNGMVIIQACYSGPLWRGYDGCQCEAAEHDQLPQRDVQDNCEVSSVQCIL